MKAKRVPGGKELLLDLDAPIWAGAESTTFEMFPTPLVMVKEVSPFLALSEGHGVIKRLDVAALHNGSMIALRLKWASEKHDKIVDLNSFVDGVGAMFPVARGAQAVTMGATGRPVNAWYWKANANEPMEIVAEGFSAVRRMKDKAGSDLKAVAQHRNGEWNVILCRSMATGDGLAKLQAGGSSKIAFAVWSGGNAERSGRKSYSGEFVDFEILK
ncbi:Gamma-subunit of ethylbenzene dehydrogenase [Aromatoleum aromaticum EbN1]|uniref:Gamma-subunit of ethylbenzene dehydrogenase n=2 Tax=Rhodocyclales TaxID=206389 RepID=Q5P5I2_AROAE|nr:ethylbenzene dehydrogenase subunit gamma [Aromatoleum aromaticum]AAK76389.1 anaerobic ethylbenzene dehydrogenase subunit C [Azoarcus sp. EB1]2IVF_C Chain C, Ethylbenzene Dehydrogenase Gamma-subunit [Aromatoleum aromaticum EbN1]CAI07430.1 Gamma-subunit of ethylbenzene dehydrogenase [Aromatoleum aromaticum EbN1]